MPFTIVYTNTKHYDIKTVFHDAYQTYLHYFNNLASSDASIAIPKKSYTLAQNVKHIDDMLQSGTETYSDSDLYYVLWSLCYYYHFADNDYKLHPQPYKKGKCILRTLEYCLVTMFYICNFLAKNHDKKMVSKLSVDLKNTPLSKNLVQKLIAEMHGKKVYGSGI